MIVPKLDLMFGRFYLGIG